MKEEDIRPQRIFDEYLRLCEVDTKRFFTDAHRVETACPACGATGETAFTKHGFAYDTCPNCRTLYVNPRPVAAAFAEYYTQAPSVEYWATTFYKETAEARREKIWKPKARLVHDALRRYGAAGHSVIDVGGGYGLFAEEMAALTGSGVTVIEPGPRLAEACREKSLVVVEKFLEDVSQADLPAGPKAYVSFELFEHLHEPSAFLGHLKDLMSAGDLFIFSTLSGTGVDIQALWADSKSVSPPHHLNFLNPHSVRILLERVGFETLEVTTPGKLDLDILKNNAALIKDRFWSSFVALADDKAREEWQSFIADSGWSSHMLAVTRKP